MGAVLVLSLTTIMGASAGPNDLDASTHQGQRKVDGVLNGFTSGNVTQYTELDEINFRFTASAIEEGTGRLAVRFSDGINECTFFQGIFELGDIVNVEGDTPTVTVIGTPTEDADAGEWVQILEVDFDGEGEAVVNYTLTLTDAAGECSGSSQHSRLDEVSGDFKNLGAMNVPVPANRIIELPEITVTKQIDRDGDGTFEDTADAGEFCFELDASGVCVPTNASGQVVFLNVTPDGPHTITEEQLIFTGGVFEFVSGSGDNCTFADDVATATVASGFTSDDASCIFNNGPADATLTVTKVVVNDNGGSAQVSDFPLFIDGTQVTSGVANTVEPGAHTVSETGLAGYTGSIGEDCAPDGTITLLPGASAECIITNDDDTARLTVTKIVVNDNGGAAVVSDFPLFIDGNPVTSGDPQSVNAGLHTVSETSLPGYVGTIGGDCAADGTITLDPGELADCTITNNDQPAQLTVTKIVVNDNGGDAVVADFPLFVNGNPVTSGSANVLNAGAYTVSETNLAGYSATIGGDCAADGTITLSPGEVAACTITNDDDTARLTVTKIVVNDDGGTAEVGDFPLFIDGNPVDSGDPQSVNAGLHTVSETTLDGYTGVIGGDCAADGTITLDPGELAECTITNDDPEPSLGRIIVRKAGDQYDTDKEFPFSSNFDGNANDGADFSLEVGDEQAFDLVAGTYSVNELVPSGWELVSAVCSDQSPATAIDLAVEETVTCIFTNKKKVNEYDQYPGDNDFDFDTPFDDAGDPGTPAPTGDTAGTNDQVGTQQPAAPVVENSTVSQPQPEPVAPVALDQLPRTGQGLDRLTTLGGMMLLLGGLTVMVSRRRKAHQA